MRHIAARDAAYLLRLSTATIHKWAREGRIHRYDDGYDIDELVTASQSRSLDALLSRAGIKMADRDTPMIRSA